MSAPERIYVATDVSNLWKSCREAFGDSARVDFQVLGSFIPALRYPVAVQQRLVAYLVTNPEQKHHVFAQVLRSLGYQVRERFLRFEKGQKKPTRTDWDVGIAIDAIANMDEYDTFALVSGDGDFGLLLDHLRARGKHTIVLSFKHATSKALHGSADELHTFGGNIVFKGAGSVITP